MRVLDLFCGAGGAAMGLHWAWPHAEITGVDIVPMPRYPFNFILANAMTFPLEGYDFIWASPPCQFYSRTQHRKNAGIIYPDLIGPIRARIAPTKTLYCIENVTGARKWLRQPYLLCGGMFALGVVRHRLFETNFPMVIPPHQCNSKRVDVYLVSVTQHGPSARWYRRNPGRRFNVKIWHDAMGIDWMTRETLTQAIPPAYSEFIAKQVPSLLITDFTCQGKRGGVD